MTAEHQPPQDDKDRKITELEIQIRLYEELIMLQDDVIKAQQKRIEILEKFLHFPPTRNGREN